MVKVGEIRSAVSKILGPNINLSVSWRDPDFVTITYGGALTGEQVRQVHETLHLMRWRGAIVTSPTAGRDVARWNNILDAAWWCEHREECPSIAVSCRGCKYNSLGSWFAKCPTCGEGHHTEAAFKEAVIEYAKGLRYNRMPWPD